MPRLVLPAPTTPVLLTVLPRQAIALMEDCEGEVEEGCVAPWSPATKFLLSWEVKHGPYRFLQFPRFFFFTPSSPVEDDDVAEEEDEEGWGRL